MVTDHIWLVERGEIAQDFIYSLTSNHVVLNFFRQSTVMRVARATPLFARIMVFSMRRFPGKYPAQWKGWFYLLVALISEHPSVIRSELYRWKHWGRFTLAAKRHWPLIAETVLRVPDRRIRNLALTVKWPPLARKHTLMHGVQCAGHVHLLIRRYGRQIVTTSLMWHSMHETDVFLAMLTVWPGALKSATLVQKFEAFQVESKRRGRCVEVLFNNRDLAEMFGSASRSRRLRLE